MSEGFLLVKGDDGHVSSIKVAVEVSTQAVIAALNEEAREQATQIHALILERDDLVRECEELRRQRDDARRIAVDAGAFL